MQPHDFWQILHPPGSFACDVAHERFFPATLTDGRQVQLPIRPLSDGRHALASLIINQASFAVVDALAEGLATRLRAYAPDVVIGLPTLGLTLASEVAKKLGHGRYVPLGTSRKFWYEDALSVPLSSITTPDQIKRLYIDPRMLPMIESARVALIDDVISSGTSIKAALTLLQSRGITPVVIGAAMLQSDRWKPSLEAFAPGLPEIVEGCFATPMLERHPDGFKPVSIAE
ncbi:phosphoribosyltransferase [Rhizobium oryziradicis]|uniref:Phosphoribosyltransferase n=1 Tax=Rhizobium oryziradicis TaxID=1867956 RepID=A0A1Q8ZW79_9HYPH|nr:phosphoribosyltransferase [Rhizobium oryziradicis]OLP46237.1 phosphoribosyltransferase [Rhizobium oryziradicis]